MAKRKSPTKAQIYKKCLKVAGDIAKTRDGWSCCRCGRRKGQVQIQASHVIPKSACKILAVDPENIKALCSHCHRWWWHLSPLEAGVWFTDLYPVRAANLLAQFDKHGKTNPPIQWWRDKLEFLEVDFQTERRLKDDHRA